MITQVQRPRSIGTFSRLFFLTSGWPVEFLSSQTFICALRCFTDYKIYYRIDIVSALKKGRLTKAMLARKACFITFVFIADWLYLCTCHSVPTFFGRINPDGSLMDVRSSQYRLKYFDSPLKPSQKNEIYLRVQPEIVDNGEEVVVSWSSATNGSQSDVVALYCPPGDKNAAYLDYIFLNETGSDFKAEKGNFKVRLFNMRVDCEMRYFHEDGLGTRLAARSNTIRFVGGDKQPLQGRLALTGKPTEMRVMWTSGSDSMPVVVYGLNDTSLTLKATGSTSTYKAEDMCGEPASGKGFRDPGYIHDVLLTGLKPGIKYFYQFGSAEVMSKIYNFTAAPIPGANVPIKFVAYGDMGVSPSPGADVTARYSLEEVKNGAQLVLHIGDISYARGYAYLWDKWHALIEPYSTLVPYMVGVGNHEQDHTKGGKKDPSGAGEGFHPSWGNFGDDSGGECGVPMYKRFHMPDNGNALWWYSYDYGSVHFIMMSTEHNFTRGSVQYKWLVDDLENVDHTLTPWIVFMGHRPMYTSQLVVGQNPTIALHMQIEMEDVLMKYKVDLALWGHYHSYERTCPVYKQSCVPQGPTHIIIGTAGYDLTFDPWPDPERKWSVHHSANFGYGRVTVANSSALLWEFVLNINGEVEDRVWLIK